MKGPKAPEAPDPVATANAQQGLNFNTALTGQMMNMTNQVTPYGNLNYKQTGMQSFTDPATGKVTQVPQFTGTQTLSPEQKALYQSQSKAGLNMSNLANQQISKLGGILGTNVNMANAPKVNTPQLGQVGAGPNMATSIAGAGGINKSIAGAGKIGSTFGSAGNITKTYGDDAGYAQQRQRVEGALMSRMNPQLARDKASMTAALANQGIKQGTEAYDREMQNQGQIGNDARMQAILAGGQEQSRLAGLDQNKAQFQNSAQGQAYDQALGRGMFANSAQAQRFGQNATQATFGNAAQAQQFGQNATQADFGNSAKQQMYTNQMGATGFNNQQAQQQFGNQQSMRSNWLNEQYANKNQPLNQIAALLGGGQVQNPNFINGPQANLANTDYAGMVQNNYGNQVEAYKMQAANNPMNGIMGGLFGLGKAAIMASDRRLKTDVSFLGMLRDLPIYAYRYIWGGPMQVGVMAQDMLRLRPDAVVPMGDFLAVDYSKVL